MTDQPTDEQIWDETQQSKVMVLVLIFAQVLKSLVIQISKI